MKTILAVGIGLLAATTLVRADETVRYVALVNGGTAKAGPSVGDPGQRRHDESRLHFKDNGRGPTLKEEYKLGDDGTFVTTTSPGQSDDRRADRRIVRAQGDKAHWKSTSDKGEQAVQRHGAVHAARRHAARSVGRDRGARQSRRRQAAADSERNAELSQARRGRGVERRRTRARCNSSRSPASVSRRRSAWVTKDASPRLFAFIFPGFLQLIEEG